MTLTQPARAAIATGLALAASLAVLTGPAAAQLTIEPEPVPQPSLPTIVTACSQIASVSPASARPGQDVDIRITPPSGLISLGYSVVGVQFANGVPATFSTVAAHHVRAKVPVGSVTGPVRVTCRSPLTGGTWSISSTTNFTPLSFGNTLNPSSTNLIVGNSTSVTATLSHPAPAPITLSLTPSGALSVGTSAPGAPGSVTIPAGAQSASFSVRAHSAAAAATVVVSGPNVASATLTVNVPTPSFSLDVPVDEADVHWGDSASYAVEVESHNGFAGTVNLTATGLPFGASAAPVSVAVPAGGSANATFTVATAQSATALGTDGFTLRGQSPNASTQNESLDLRVLPDTGNFAGLTWRTTDSTCGSFEADVNGTANSNVTFDGPGFSPQAHSHVRYAWTPDCRGAVVMGPAAGPNTGWPASIFNFGFDTAIADGPGSRHNLGLAAWNHGQFKASQDGSLVIAVAQSNTFNASLFDMLSLSRRGVTDSYTITESLAASVVGDEVHAVPSGSSDDWTWTLP